MRWEIRKEGREAGGSWRKQAPGLLRSGRTGGATGTKGAGEGRQLRFCALKSCGTNEPT